MADICKADKCRRQLSEYRDLTSKLYADIESLEDDFKEKENFVQTVVRARNSFQEEVANMKKKNNYLMKENNELSEKVEQLDEDTDTGVELLKNAQERERKLTNSFEEYKKNCASGKEKFSQLTKENQTRNTSRAHERSSRKICPRLWKDMWNSIDSRCGSQYLEGFPQIKHCLKPYLTFGIELCFYNIKYHDK
jgi:chromosome segregation ATPase